MFFCDSCYTEKDGIRKDLDPDSVNTCVYRQPFRCVKREQWLRHLKTDKHCRNVATANNLRDELIHECKHCGVRLDDRSYKIHTQRNYMLWACHGMEYTKECSCNNFILNGKRFNSFGALREYYNNKQKYGYGKDNKIDYRKKLYDEANKILEDRDKHTKEMIEARKRSEAKLLKELEKKREKEANALEEKRRRTQEKNRIVEKMEKKEEERKNKKEQNLTMEIKEITKDTMVRGKLSTNLMNKVAPKKSDKLEDEFNKLNGIETKEDRKNNKLDITIKPVWGIVDWCDDCNKYTNEYKEYPEEKMKRWNIDLCLCGETDEESGDSDFD